MSGKTTKAVFIRSLCGLLLLTFLLSAETAFGCPTCKETLAHGDPETANLMRGYFWSILFMMSMPFLILGGLGSYFYYEVCKARRLQASQVV